ncbi:UDP-glucose/GDP-mannose dehydrogenase family protein [Pseudomonas neustonica]|uniref:UDP-glucose 6-dehydrogenase n=1 Tax=Pseudomonas neustonica TaxID=2487346 RepID=A0ABX9XEZ7_9PSED|nr:MULTISPECIES: nucleotide sugar dehydrogenase [Pseudomonas]ROZ81146.1 UDP-glucose/GDP-mannose dehydrogenase family protein [Pseudomonas sp. SSM44]ROZ82345.1 UDP-glucose/GDP-mannose dehydrogenase family protein [Pseudomonas neustonica]|tara:strand:- start:3615 stop:4910 length:1296 start_codon:yes stop_codon:yes gene_type:complete
MHLDVYGDTLCALVAATALASSGNNVQLHVPEGNVAMQLARRECPFREPGLAEMMAEQAESGRLLLCTMQTPPHQASTVVWLALSPDALELAHAVVTALPTDRVQPWLVVNQSTFAVGTSDSLQQALSARAELSDTDCAVVSLPDLLIEGNALQSFMRADSWLLGSEHLWAQNLVAELLRPFNRRRDAVMVMSSREAEFSKLAITGMLATRLSYMNDMANLADTLQVDIERVRQGMGADKRIGDAYLYPGCGFGGLSFSRDVMSLATTLQGSGMQPQLLDEVLRINERQKEVLFRKLWQHYGTNLRGRRVAIWGVSFKPETSRIDNSPALKLMEALWAQGVEVHVHDPRALGVLREWAGERDDLVLHDDPYEAAAGADALMLVTEWKAYWSPDLFRLKMSMAHPLLLDGRNVWDPDFMKQSGFDYLGIGRR